MYSANSPLKSTGLASASDIQNWFLSQNGKAPAGIGNAVVAECAAYGLNGDLVASQIVHETGYWTSAIANDKNNPAGIGAVNDNAYNGAIIFATPRDGIHCQVAHLLSYIDGNTNPIKRDDPRFSAIPTNNLGSVSCLSDLDGKWAYPGNGYGAAIANLANQLVSRVSMIRDEKAQWLASSNFDSGHKSREFIIIHTTEGAFDGAVSWLRGSASGSSNRDSSAHYVISADGSRIDQLVDENDTSWAAGNLDYNRRGINIEQEGYANLGGFSEGLYQACGQLVGRIAKRRNIPLEYTGKSGKPGIIGHMDVPDGHGGWGGVDNHNDPGSHYDFNKLIQYARGAEPPPPDDTSHYFTETQHLVGGGFYQFWKENGGLAIFGFPISEEFTNKDGVTVQYFQRARFEWQPKIAGNEWGVVLGLVGSEDAASDKASFPAAFAPRKE